MTYHYTTNYFQDFRISNLDTLTKIYLFAIKLLNKRSIQILIMNMKICIQKKKKNLLFVRSALLKKSGSSLGPSLKFNPKPRPLAQTRTHQYYTNFFMDEPKKNLSERHKPRFFGQNLFNKAFVEQSQFMRCWMNMAKCDIRFLYSTQTHVL